MAIEDRINTAWLDKYVHGEPPPALQARVAPQSVATVIPFDAAVADLDFELATLHKSVAQLEERLSCSMFPESKDNPARAVSPDRNPRGESQRVASINALIRTVVATNARVAEILRRLEI